MGKYGDYPGAPTVLELQAYCLLARLYIWNIAWEYVPPKHNVIWHDGNIPFKGNCTVSERSVGQAKKFHPAMNFLIPHATRNKILVKK